MQDVERMEVTCPEDFAEWGLEDTALSVQTSCRAMKPTWIFAIPTERKTEKTGNCPGNGIEWKNTARRIKGLWLLSD